VALLSVAAAFLLVGVQGTALIRFGGGSASVELDLRVAAVVRRADEAAEQDPQLALGILEGAAIVEPRVGPDAKAARMLGYQSAVRRALERIQPDRAIVTTAQPPADLTIVTPTKPVLVSVVFRSSRRIQQTDLAPLVGSRQLENALGGLEVANQISTTSVANYVATAAGQGVTIEVVTWDGPEHDRDLRQALNRLFGDRSSSGGR